MTLSQQRRAGAAVCLFTSLGKVFEDGSNERARLAAKLEERLKLKDVVLESRVLGAHCTGCGRYQQPGQLGRSDILSVI